MFGRISWLVLVLVSAVGCGEDGGEPIVAPPHVARLRIRVAVADVKSPEMTVYDVADREVVARLAIDRPAEALVSSHTGETAAIVLRGGGVRILGGGVSVLLHKDHIHIFKSPSELLGDALAGAGSATAAFADGRWGIFFAGSDSPRSTASALGIAEEPWVQGTRAPVDVATGTPHRGFAVPFGDDYLVTRADAGVAVGVDRVTAGRPRTALFSCPEVAAAVSAGPAAVFACRDGLVVLGADRVPSAPIPVPAGVRVQTLAALPEQPFVIGLDETGKVLVLDLSSRSAGLLPVDGEVCDGALEIGQTPRAVVLTSAGRVERFDLARRQRTSSAPVTSAFACGAAERARLAATPGRAWVTSPSTGELIEVDTDGGSVAKRVSIGGTPGAVAILGLDARNADLSTGSDDLSE